MKIISMKAQVFHAETEAAGRNYAHNELIVGSCTFEIASTKY